jgi:hypothetical protein
MLRAVPLRNFNPDLSSSELRFRSGALAWLDAVPLPCEYRQGLRPPHAALPLAVVLQAVFA